MAADHAASKAAAKSCNDSGLHDSLADPEAYKQVEVTKQLVTLLGVAKAEQVSHASCSSPPSWHATVRACIVTCFCASVVTDMQLQPDLLRTNTV